MVRIVNAKTIPLYCYTNYNLIILSSRMKILEGYSIVYVEYPSHYF